MSAAREWTTEELEILLQCLDEDISCRAIARRLGTRTDDAVSAKLSKMGIQRAKKKRCGPGKGVPKPQHDLSRARAMFGDLLFKQAMLAAIHSGAETVIPMVVKDVSPRYTPRIHPEPQLTCGSPAASCADIAMPE